MGKLHLTPHLIATSGKTASCILDQLPESCWTDPEAVFLDICSKNGAVLQGCVSRLMKGLADAIPNEDERHAHILQKQVFAVSPTADTAKATRLALYGEKGAKAFGFSSEDGGVFFEQCRHTYLGDSKTCFDCGLEKKLFGEGGIEAYPGLHRSVNYSRWLARLPKGRLYIASDPIFTVPHPARAAKGDAKGFAIGYRFFEKAEALKAACIAMALSGKWMVERRGAGAAFRKKISDCRSIARFEIFEDAEACFDGVRVKGGACFFLYDREWHSPECQFVTHRADGTVLSEIRRLSLDGGLVCRSKDEMLLENLISRACSSKKEKTLADHYSSASTYGLPTNLKDYSEEPFEGSVKVYMNRGRIGYVRLDQIKPEARCRIKRWRVAVPAAFGDKVWQNADIKPILLEPGSAANASMITLDGWKDDAECRAVCSNLTKMAYVRHCLNIAKNTHHAAESVYGMIPACGLADPDWDDSRFKSHFSIPDDLHSRLMAG